MTGETDLAKMLSSLRIERRDDPMTVVHLASVGDLDLDLDLDLGDGVAALVTEHEGMTAVVSIAEAERRGWPVGFRAAWLTVSVHSSLTAIGLTAALAKVLADRGIACNVLAGYFHDHLLVPLDRVDEAIESLEALGG